MSVYIIGIGGSGAKFLEAVSYVAASGLYPEDIQTLLVDPDKGNGNLRECENTLSIYRKTQACINRDNPDNSIAWMIRKISAFESGLWSPFTEGKVRIRDAFKYDSYPENNAVKHLFDVLYTKEERDTDLKEGFRGRPSIGAGIMSLLSQEQKNQENWETLISKIKDEKDGGKAPKVFLCGSIFGGTGASGFPTLGRLIADELEKESLLKDIKFGGLLMLPYFRFTPSRKDVSEGKVFAKSEEFILKTEAALRYYSTKKLKFDTVYLLGTPNLANLENFSTGGQNQRNFPHFLELYGALALRDFLLTPKPNQLNIVTIGRKDSSLVSWDDLPDRNEVRSKLVTMTRFAFAWLSAIAPDLDNIRKGAREQQYIWYLKFFRKVKITDTQELDTFKQISEWVENYLTWLGYIHDKPGGEEVKWFNSYNFWDSNNKALKKDRTNFSKLVEEIKGVELNKILEGLNDKDIGVPKDGTVGLAKALYKAISQI